jgi:preprotein translocase SecF subunit
MDVLKNRKIYYIVFGILSIISLWVLLFGKLNLAIDMTGGINMEYTYENSVNIDDIKREIWEAAENLTFDWKRVINNIWVYSITWEKAFSVVAGFDTNIEEKTLESLKLQFRNSTLELLRKMDSTVIETKYVNIWKTFWDYIKRTAILTLVLAAVGITIYIWYAFSGVVSGINSFSFSIVTLLTLVHDVLVSAGIYIIFWYFFQDFQIDTFFVTALLTVLWYSINDKIVIFDRIRLNLREFWGKTGKNWKDLYEIVNTSVTDTLRRSIFTSLTLFFVLLTIFLFGPETLSGFTLVMMIGTIIWTCSSIFLASTLFYDINKDKKLTIYKEKTYRAEDKIVV